jgi:phosphate transport system permease protein
MSEPITKPIANAMQSASHQRYQQWRLFKDRLVRYGIVVGGLGVIGAIVLIFFYLLYVVLPLFGAAKVSELATYTLPEAGLGKTLALETEEQNEVGVRATDQGYLVFFDVATGKTLLTQKAAIPEGATISSFTQTTPINDNGFVYGLSTGKIVVLKIKYAVTYPNNQRKITPSLEYPFGEQALLIDDNGVPVEKLGVRLVNDNVTVVAKVGNKINLVSFNKEQALFSDEASITRTAAALDFAADNVTAMLLEKEARQLYLVDEDGLLSAVDINNKAAPKNLYQQKVILAGQKITSLTFLNGDISLLVGDSSGTIAQWTQVKNDLNQSTFNNIRSFKVSDQPVIAIESEQRRKGFMAVDAKGVVKLFNSTSERQLADSQIGNTAPVSATLSPRANRLMIESADAQMHTWLIDNEHPEVSFKSIWQKVWYESYAKPDYIWQSSSASNDFEPKYSLTPLVFGTLKATFYAMLVAMPLALLGAIYTAYFMAPQMRQIVKPTIELMGALPTVIIGFLAGLWLAPFIEKNLAGLFLSLLVLPLSVVLFAWVWQLLPQKIRQRVPEGWEALVLVPVIVVFTWLAFIVSVPLETALFGMSISDWFNHKFGIGYDQRNALVVGVAMGFAVIPSIFSIAEDAIFSVPKHLTVGSLALGATPWQTMMRVVLLTASPGIFSAVMIGLGRAIGETMIVLMATGNTPVMDFSVFQGLRTLAANVAVEMPESEVDSSHYRVLFLAALVLFMATFVFNTLAEFVRQRLREKYSSL